MTRPLRWSHALLALTTGLGGCAGLEDQARHAGTVVERGALVVDSTLHPERYPAWRPGDGEVARRQHEAIEAVLLTPQEQQDLARTRDEAERARYRDLHQWSAPAIKSRTLEATVTAQNSARDYDQWARAPPREARDAYQRGLIRQQLRGPAGGYRRSYGWPWPAPRAYGYGY